MIKLKNKNTLVLIIILFFISLFIYKYSPRRIEFLGHYNKVFAHRVNSIKKLEAALKYFEGIELDLVYFPKTNVLDVNHPPAKSINLNFETYLNKIVEAKKQPFIWLDIKDLDTTNANAILEKLNTLFEDKKYSKKKILVETLHPEALPAFTSAGYNTSYYLKPRLYKRKPKALEEEIKYIKKILNKQPNIGISASYVDYEILNKYFPNKKKYVWALSSPYVFKYSKVRRILNDTTVKIVLSSFKSLKGNR